MGGPPALDPPFSCREVRTHWLLPAKPDVNPLVWCPKCAHNGVRVPDPVRPLDGRFAACALHIILA